MKLHFAPSFLILAGKEDNFKISDEFEIWPDLTTDCGVSCHRAFGKITIYLYWEKCDRSSAIISDRIFFFLAGIKDIHKRLDEFQFRHDPTTNCRDSCP